MVRSASAACSAFRASAIAADNLERKTIRETATSTDFAKSAVVADNSVRTFSKIVFGLFRTFLLLTPYSYTRKKHVPPAARAEALRKPRHK
jgi:hypothetical protein